MRSMHHSLHHANDLLPPAVTNTLWAMLQPACSATDAMRARSRQHVLWAPADNDIMQRNAVCRK